VKRLAATLAAVLLLAYASMIVVNCPGEMCSVWPMGAFPTLKLTESGEISGVLAVSDGGTGISFGNCASNSYLRGDGTCAFSIPAGEPVGAALTFVNNGEGGVSIETHGETLRAPDGETGSERLPPGSAASAVKVSEQEWLIVGARSE
jgi:hypothetical protein